MVFRLAPIAMGTPTFLAALAAFAVLAAAAKIEHVVVLVMENRSFDHMVRGAGLHTPVTPCQPRDVVTTACGPRFI
jgi:phospholipase C